MNENLNTDQNLKYGPKSEKMEQIPKEKKRIKVNKNWIRIQNMQQNPEISKWIKVQNWIKIRKIIQTPKLDQNPKNHKMDQKKKKYIKIQDMDQNPKNGSKSKNG